MSQLWQEVKDVPLERNVFYRGKIATNPAETSDRVDVIIPEFHEHLRWQHCRWIPRSDIELPSRGDACVLVLDSHGDPWVVAWDPYTNT